MGRTARVERPGLNGRVERPGSNGSENLIPIHELRPVSTKLRPGRGEDAERMRASATRKGVSRAAARPPCPNREKAAPRSAAALTVLIGRYLHRPSPAALKPPLGHIRPITKKT